MGDPLVRVYEQGKDESDEAFAERIAAAYAKADEETPLPSPLDRIAQDLEAY